MLYDPQWRLGSRGLYTENYNMWHVLGKGTLVHPALRAFFADRVTIISLTYQAFWGEYTYSKTIILTVDIIQCCHAFIMMYHHVE